MQNQQSQQSKASTSLNDYLNALQRVFRIAVYYPTGHKALDQATNRFMTLHADITAETQSATFQVFGPTLKLNEIDLEENQPFVNEFNTILSTLGMSTLGIDRHITEGELHEAIRKMLAHKARVTNTRQFTQVEVTDLPPSISIGQQEFLARKDPRVTHDYDDEVGDLDTFVESLSNYGLNETEIRECKTLLETLPDKLERSSMDVADLPYASWDDVANLLARTVRSEKKGGKEGQSSPSSQSNINALATILKKLEVETQDKKSREALNLIVSIIRKPVSEDNDDDSGKEAQKSFPAQPTISAAKIQAFADKLKLTPKVLRQIPESDSGPETLSIMIQLARYEQPLAIQIRMQQFFRELLSNTIEKKKWDTLCGGLHMIVQTGQVARINFLIKIILDPLRRSLSNNSLILFQRVSRLCSTQENQLLWPHIVNEILVIGSSKDKLVYHELCQSCAKFSHDHMTSHLPHLKALDAFQDSKIASDIFHSISPSCYPLFAFLYKTEIERYIGERVIGGLKRNPQDWLIKAVAPLLDLTIQEHKLFLYSYLRQAAQKVISDPLKKIAARIVVDSLNNLPQERRNESWVTNTIQAMAQMPRDITSELLSQIASGRKLLFMHQWPVQCRKAAESALSHK